MQVSEIRQVLVEKYKNDDFVIDKTGAKVIEIVGASFTANEPIIFGNTDGDYIERELAWYKSMSRMVEDIPGKTPKIWTEVCSKTGKINSNYGWCIWSKENQWQYSSVLYELHTHKDSRRAVMIYTRPTMHLDYRDNGMSDFICTNDVQYLIRNNKLEVVVQMRSNDVVFGYKNDYAWQLYVQQELVRDLLSSYPSIQAGSITWQVGSLHLYERHFKLLDEYLEQISL